MQIEQDHTGKISFRPSHESRIQLQLRADIIRKGMRIASEMFPNVPHEHLLKNSVVRMEEGQEWLVVFGTKVIEIK